VAKKQKQTDFFYKKVVKIPIYGGNFIIIFSNNAEKVRKIVNCSLLINDPLYASTFHNFIYGGYESFCVTFNLWNDTSEITMGTIMHEVNHVGNRILLARYAQPDYDNDEAESYLKGWLGDQVHKFMIDCDLV